MISKPGHFYKKHNKHHSYELIMKNINKVENSLDTLQSSNLKAIMGKQASLNEEGSKDSLLYATEQVVPKKSLKTEGGVTTRLAKRTADPEEPGSKKQLDTFDPYMNIYFSLEKMNPEVQKHLRERKTDLFSDYRSEANRFIPADMMMTSKCYRSVNEKTKEKEKFKIHVIKQQSYLDNINDLIG